MKRWYSDSIRSIFSFCLLVVMSLTIWKCMISIWNRKMRHLTQLCEWWRLSRILPELGNFDWFLSTPSPFQMFFHIYNLISCSSVNSSNPSIEDDTPFRSCTSPNDIFCQEISNNPKSSVAANIKEQLHYDTCREIEEIYKESKIPQEFQGM